MGTLFYKMVGHVNQGRIFPFQICRKQCQHTPFVQLTITLFEPEYRSLFIPVRIGYIMLAGYHSCGSAAFKNTGRQLIRNEHLVRLKKGNRQRRYLCVCLYVAGTGCNQIDPLTINRILPVLPMIQFHGQIIKIGIAYRKNIVNINGWFQPCMYCFN